MTGIEDLSLWHLQFWHGDIREFSRVDFCYNLSYLIMLFPTLSDLKQNRLIIYSSVKRREKRAQQLQPGNTSEIIP